jgi:hypothetical protein
VAASRTKLKRLIVNPTTGEFLARGGKWTGDEEEAIDFADIMSVIVACAKHRIKDAEVLLRFREGEKFDVRLPLRRKVESQSKLSSGI